jgi:hypothetical protein
MQKVLIEVAETESPHCLFDVIKDLKVMGSVVYIVTNSPIVSGAIISVLGNLNKAIIINSCVIKSFIANYPVGKYVADDVDLVIKINNESQEQELYQHLYRKCTCGSGDVWSECNGINGDSSYCG